MLNITNVVWANGHLSDSSLQWTVERLPNRTNFTIGDIRRRLNSLSPSNPLYIVGMVSHHGAQGVGGWIDGDTLYVDPVFITGLRDLAISIATDHQQVALFRMDRVVDTQYVEGTDLDTLLDTLSNFSRQYGGATAYPVKGGYLVFAGEGEVVYL